MKCIGSLVLLTTLVTGCGQHVSFIKTNASPQAMQPRSKDSVQVFVTTLPERRYLELGIIEAKPRALAPNGDTESFEKLHEESARRGCDGLIVLGSNEAVETTYTPQGQTTALTRRGYRGMCIAWKQEGDPA